VARAYNSPARQAAAEKTRDALIQAALDLLMQAEGDAGLSHREIAERAGVSLRTAYNHFPTRDDMLDVVDAALAERLGRSPPNMDNPVAAIRPLYEFFEKNEDLIRVVSERRSLRELRARRRARGRKRMEVWVKAELPEADRAARRELLALLSLFLASATWIDLRDKGLSTSAAASLAERVVKTELARQRRAARAG
jgi:AcrR family transcriptional regulator